MDPGLVCCESEVIQRAYEDPVLLKDIRVLQTLLQTEDKYMPRHSYFTIFQTDIKPYMRKMVAQWMLEVCEEQRCEEEVFPLAINYLDRVLCVKVIHRTSLQLLGAACMFLSSKLKETCPLSAEKLVVYTDNSIGLQQLMDMESLVLHYLRWDLSAVTPHDFLEQILSRLQFDVNQYDRLKRHTQTFIALCCTDCKFMLYPPSMIAAGCIGAAARGLCSPEGQLDSKLLLRLHKITHIDVDCLRSCQEQVEETVSSNLMSLSENSPKTPTKSDDLNEQPTTPTDVRDIHI
ncbi:G1/S-specific cyclin-D2-like [Gigantopelta aegis]|uniref:G1/S-specific cyclin-D2-like n=1 Tax=Gigantopelta aegis TaxID=1735272 RepID=UPI001B88E326|nr:G1/S-specific cyclin-D2-like [Gigantopelta aegis]